MSAQGPTRMQLLEMIGAAILAPSVHNTQPWLFGILPDGVEIFPDERRRLLVSDPDGRAVRVSCGAALLNLRLAVQHAGFTPEVETVFEPGGPLARVRAGTAVQPTPADVALFEAIPRRHSNRYPLLDTEVSAAERRDLVAAAESEGAWLSLVMGPVALEIVVEMVRMADRMLAGDPDYLAELAAWSRSDPSSVDGVTRPAGGPAPEPYDPLVGRDFGGLTRSPGHDFEQEPFVAVLGTSLGSPADDLTAGQALQKVLLTATRLGLTVSLISQPIDVAGVREQLRIGLHRHGPPQMLLRLGRGLPPDPTGRRPVADVLLTPGERPADLAAHGRAVPA